MDDVLYMIKIKGGKNPRRSWVACTSWSNGGFWYGTRRQAYAFTKAELKSPEFKAFTDGKEYETVEDAGEEKKPNHEVLMKVLPAVHIAEDANI
jgi:hypothetical protein